jgi:hypothetical protein
VFVLRLLSLVLLLPALPATASAQPLSCPSGLCTMIGRSMLQWDATVRLRGLYYDPVRFGVGGGEDGLGLLRALGSVAYLRGDWQARLQLGAHAEAGRRGGPGGTDRGALDVQQAYGRWQRGALWVQAGRQEAGYGSSRILSVRDGPNIRLAYDGVRLGWRGAAGRVDLLALQPVENRRGAFDDHGTRDAHLWGAYATVAAGPAYAGHWDIYLLDSQRDAARFAEGRGRERRQTLGSRWFGQDGTLDWNVEAVGQAGHLRTDTALSGIRAWTVASDAGWRWPGVPLQPRLGLKVDIASGDRRAGDGRLQTFNALYPKSSYFSEASLLAPANLMDVQPTVDLQFGERLSTQFGVQLAWKQQRADAVYTTPAPLVPLPGSAGGARRIGTQYKAETRWQASDDWLWEWQLAWMDAGTALRQAGGRDTLFASLAGTWTW